MRDAAAEPGEDLPELGDDERTEGDQEERAARVEHLLHPVAPPQEEHHRADREHQDADRCEHGGSSSYTSASRPNTATSSPLTARRYSAGRASMVSVPSPSIRRSVT